jgi:hypothetical protein
MDNPETINVRENRRVNEEDNPGNLAAMCTQGTRRRRIKYKKKPQHNMCGTPLYTNKHK